MASDSQSKIACHLSAGRSNDVCNGHPDTLAHMTTPQEMRAAALDTMTYLDTQLPAGSAVFLTGLANGSILYDVMANRIHPIGALHNNVPTKAVYEFLNCLEISPCRGWMNQNGERPAGLCGEGADFVGCLLMP